MQVFNHPTRHRSDVLASWVLLFAALGMFGRIIKADDIEEMLGTAKPATAPGPLTSPDAPENQPVPATAPTAKAPRESRMATITLNNGTVLKGPIWTTTATPFRLWIDAEKVYKDIDFDVVKGIEVKVISQTMEDDWRWLKEGSDQKVYSGKKYPNVELNYRFTLLNDQAIEGSVLAPIYFADPDTQKTRTFALYKKFKGNLDQKMEDLLYIKSITLEPPATPPAARTTKLPLLPD